MPRCIVISETPVTATKNLYEVVFEADDGYQEQQKYQCTETELKTALTHFNDSVLKSVTADASVEEPRIITVAPSKDAQEAMSKLSG